MTTEFAKHVFDTVPDAAGAVLSQVHPVARVDDKGSVDLFAQPDGKRQWSFNLPAATSVYAHVGSHGNEFDKDAPENKSLPNIAGRKTIIPSNAASVLTLVFCDPVKPFGPGEFEPVEDTDGQYQPRSIPDEHVRIVHQLNRIYNEMVAAVVMTPKLRGNLPKLADLVVRGIRKYQEKGGAAYDKLASIAREGCAQFEITVRPFEAEWKEFIGIASCTDAMKEEADALDKAYEAIKAAIATPGEFDIRALDDKALAYGVAWKFFAEIFKSKINGVDVTLKTESGSVRMFVPGVVATSPIFHRGADEKKKRWEEIMAAANAGNGEAIKQRDGHKAHVLKQIPPTHKAMRDYWLANPSCAYSPLPVFRADNKTPIPVYTTFFNERQNTEEYYDRYLPEATVVNANCTFKVWGLPLSGSMALKKDMTGIDFSGLLGIGLYVNRATQLYRPPPKKRGGNQPDYSQFVSGDNYAMGRPAEAGAGAASAAADLAYTAEHAEEFVTE